MKQSLITLAALAAIGLTSAAQAEVQYGISNPDAAITVGEAELGTPSHPLQPGEPGIGHGSLAGGQRVSFSSLQDLGDTTGTGVGSADNWKFTHVDPSMGPPSHAGIGYFNFVQAAEHAVFAGEWSQDEASSTDPTHTVYYAGVVGNVATTLPTGSDVTYSVKSVNNAYQTVSSAGLPNSTLTANFGTLTASSSGDIHFDDGEIKVGESRVQLEASGVSVTSVSGTDGDLVGDFFGTGAAAVAGIITFADSAKDTAFAGAQN